MSIVKKENSQYTVSERNVKAYLNKGFVEIDKMGKVIKEATCTRIYSSVEIAKIKSDVENKSVATILKLNSEIKQLQNEITKSHAEITKLKSTK
jgi:predicted transcriptional regulator